MSDLSSSWLIQLLVDVAAALQPLPPANTTHLSAAIARLNHLVPAATKGTPQVSTPSGLVQILQSDLDNFTDKINSAVEVLAVYIQQLVANQATPLAAADEAAINSALDALQAIEPLQPGS